MICFWKIENNGMMGFDDFEYKTDCDNSIDIKNITKNFIYCPYCGKEIERGKNRKENRKNKIENLR